MNLDNHILQLLARTPDRARPVSIGDFAREFGTTVTVVLPAARRLVDSGQATAVMADVHGVSTLRALLPAAARVPPA